MDILELLIGFLILIAVACGTALNGKFLLPQLRRLHLGQRVRDDGPKTHLVKTGTPTFGGLMFLPPIAVVGLVLYLIGGFRSDIGILTLLILAMGAIGFVDDFVKVRINKEGLTVRQKTGLMLGLCVLAALYIIFAHGDPVIYLFFPPYRLVVFGAWRIIYALFVVVYLYFCINAVNLTDGLDGLASGVSAVVSISLGLLILLPANYSTDLGRISFAGAGGCLGFLVYNRYPAKVFMGDTGSLALGAAVSMIPLLMGIPWLFALYGIIYVTEALSVVIQVSFFKATHGRRIFRMSPIHHHFELGGWPETKIVRVFILVTVVGIIIGLLLANMCKI